MMGKLTLAIIVSIFAYGIYQLFKGSPLLSIATMLFAVIVFLVLYCRVDIFDEIVSLLSTAIVILTVIHVVKTSDVFDVNNGKKQYDLMMQSVEAGFCPVRNQPDERKRAAFEQLRNTLFMSCALQHNRDVMTLTVDLSKAVYLDPLTGTLDSLYTDFIKEKDFTPTCLDIAQEMSRLCPGHLDI
ncbi:hypothetical protein [Aeromonas intestinalis]